MIIKFKHYATDEIIEVKVFIISSANEIIVEELKTGKLMVVQKEKQHNRYQIKGTSFMKIENEE